MSSKRAKSKTPTPLSGDLTAIAREDAKAKVGLSGLRDPHGTEAKAVIPSVTEAFAVARPLVSSAAQPIPDGLTANDVRVLALQRQRDTVRAAFLHGCITTRLTESRRAGTISFNEYTEQMIKVVEVFGSVSA